MQQDPWAVIHVPGLDTAQAARVLRYMRTVNMTARRVTSDSVEQGVLTDQRFVGVIYPCGDQFPAGIYEPLRRFHKTRGHICWLGGVPFRKPVTRDGNGVWRVDFNTRIDGLPCWLHLLNEDIGPCSWSSLIERWGLYCDPLLDSQRISRIERPSRAFGDIDAKTRDSITATVGPLERRMNFRSLLHAYDDDDAPLGSIAFCATHRSGPFKSAAIVGLLCPLPKGTAGAALLRSLLDSISSDSGIPEEPAEIGRKAMFRPGLGHGKIVSPKPGSTRLVVNGVAHFPAMYEFELTHRCFRRSIPNLYRTGIRIFKPYLSLFPTWIGPDEHDYRWFDRVMELVLAAAPQGWLMPHISLLPGPWWHDMYPEELRQNDAEIPEGLSGSSACSIANGPVCPSVASRLWRTQLKGALAALIDHVKSSPYGSRLIGFNLAFGHASEWIESAWSHNRWSLGDSHPDMVRQFQEFCNSDAHWRRRKAHVPGRHERQVSDGGFFLDPAKGHLVTLWYQFLVRQTTAMLDDVASHIKKVSGNRLLTGAMSGYLFAAGRCAYLHADAISSAVSNYLPMNSLDMLEAPHGYDRRETIGGDCTHRGLPDVLPYHGKLFINQNDQRTHRERRPGERMYGASETPDPAESCHRLKRNTAAAMVRNAGQSWFDFGLSWFDDPLYLRTLRQLLDLGRRSLDWRKGHLDGLGIVVDDQCLFHQRMANTLIYRLMYDQKNRFFNRIGTAWYIYHLKDLLDGKVKPTHKTWLFLNTFFLSASQRNRLRSIFCRDNRSLIWLYAPGYQSPGGLSADNITELTGIKIKMLKAVGSGQVTLTNFDDPLTGGIDECSSHALLGARDTDDKASILEPMFYIDDPKARVLGRLEAVNLPGFAMKQFRNHTSIYAATPQLNEVIYRNICRQAGTHVYCSTGDNVYIHHSLIAITAEQSGRKTLLLPQRRAIADALTGRAVAPLTRQFAINMKAGQTRLFALRKH